MHERDDDADEQTDSDATGNRTSCEPIERWITKIWRERLEQPVALDRSRVGIWRLSQFERGAGVASGIVPQQPLLFPLPIPLLHRLALVVFLFAARQCQLDFGPATCVEIDRKRDQG